MTDGYAPQSIKATEETSSVHAELEELIDRFKKTHIGMIMGDVYVILQYRQMRRKS